MFQLPRLPPRFDVALRDVASERPEFRLEAAEVLGRASSPEERERAREALRGLLDDDVARIRATALDALGFVGHDADVPAILRATRDPRPALREAATMALGRLGGESALEALRGLLDSEWPEVRYQAVVALGALGDAVASGVIAARLDDSDGFVREAAVGALVGLGASEHREAIAARLDDAPGIALAAAHALAALGDPRALPRLRDDVAGGRPSSETLSALAQLKDDPSRESLAALVNRWWAPRALRAECAAVLAVLGDVRGVEHLRGMLRALRLGPRLEALAFVARYGVVDCAAEVAAMVDRPRGLPSDVLAHTLERLEAAPEARLALGRLDEQRALP